MIQKVIETWYVTEKGMRFKTYAEAEERENLDYDIEKVQSIIGPSYDKTDADKLASKIYSDMNEKKYPIIYIQHSKETYLKFLKGIIDLVENNTSSNFMSFKKFGGGGGWWNQWKEYAEFLIFSDGNNDKDYVKQIHSSWICRAASEVCPELSSLLYRLECIDLNYREWQQPYYKNEADKNPQIIQDNLDNEFSLYFDYEKNLKKYLPN